MHHVGKSLSHKRNTINTCYNRFHVHHGRGLSHQAVMTVVSQGVFAKRNCDDSSMTGVCTIKTVSHLLHVPCFACLIICLCFVFFVEFGLFVLVFVLLAFVCFWGARGSGVGEGCPPPSPKKMKQAVSQKKLKPDFVRKKKLPTLGGRGKG